VIETDVLGVNVMTLIDTLSPFDICHVLNHSVSDESSEGEAFEFSQRKLFLDEGLARCAIMTLKITHLSFIFLYV
jgi:hypothetical protein